MIPHLKLVSEQHCEVTAMGAFGGLLTQFLLYYEVVDTWHAILSFC
jgi:hypothetical protein